MPPKRPRPLADAVSSRMGRAPAVVTPSPLCEPAEPVESFPGEASDAAMALAVLRQGWIGEVPVPVTASATRVLVRVSPFPVFIPTHIFSIVGTSGPVTARVIAELGALEARGSLLLCASPLPHPNNVVAVSVSALHRFYSERVAAPACSAVIRAGISVVMHALDLRAGSRGASAPASAAAVLRPFELTGAALEAARMELLRAAVAARTAAHTSGAGAGVGPPLAAASPALLLPIPPLDALLGPLLQLGLLTQLPSSTGGGRARSGEGAAAMRAALAAPSGQQQPGADERLRTAAAFSAASAGVWALGVPEAGRLWEWAEAGRRELLQRLARRPHGELPREAGGGLSLARSRLPVSFHLRDVLGAGLVEEVASASGPLLRITAAGAALAAPSAAAGSGRGRRG